MSAAQVAAEYYATKTAQGHKVTGQELADVAQKSRSWGSQTLRKLQAAAQTQETVHTPPAPVDTPAQEVRTASVAGTAHRLEGRTVAWCAFALGTVLSVAANVLEAPDRPEARLAWGVVPLLLLASVEVLMRVRWRQGSLWWKAAGYFGATVVALVAFTASYTHQRSLLLGLGDSELNATIVPLAVDGLLLVGGVALVRGKRKGEA